MTLESTSMGVSTAYAARDSAPNAQPYLGGCLALTPSLPGPYTQENMAADEHDLFGPLRLTRTHFAGIFLVSAIYFADIFLRASAKCYWFDELFTVYLCRLPSFNNIWAAVLHGADFNPPLFYLLTRGAQGLFGNGLIATRLPATVGVWVFGLCLFLFVSRRTGVICGFIAGVFPFFTLAQYYAYEARAHGLILGWCGLALICWQRNAEGRAKYLWLAGFGLSLLGALLTHVYAVYLFVPFAVVELYNLLKRDRPDWGILCVLLLVPAPVIVVLYLPLFRMYRASVPAGFFVPSHELLQYFLADAFGPALSVLLLSLVLFGLEGMWRPGLAAAKVKIPKREVLVAAGFVCLPLLGFLGSKLSRGPFLDRYFLSSIGGIAIFLGFAHAQRPAGSRSTQVLAICMMLLMIADLGTMIYLVTASHRIFLVEPSTRTTMTTTPSDPMRMYSTVSHDQSGLDILVLPSLEYFYFFEYAPPSVVSRLYFASSESDANLSLYEKLGQWGHVNFKTTTFSSFLTSHKRFRVYASGREEQLDAAQAIASGGYRLASAEGDASGIMYEYTK
jgi:hypothetical protein